ncbi:acyl-CoA thioesterase [Candidatus Nomurabacteria bacterium]|jgi:acyl-CoA hydrolase|nr:acyl-CoA thioesterase [Candidatus Nomurabacteria bacterium]
MSTSHVEIVMASHCNGAHRLFGGQLMSWIDITAAVEARRHSKTSVTLKAVDNLNFLSPVFMDETVAIDAALTWTGRTSMEIKVSTYVEKLNGERDLVNVAYLVFVAIDNSGEPVEVPGFVPKTDEEINEFEAASSRHIQRISRK